MLSLRFNDLKFLFFFFIAGASVSCVTGDQVAYNALNRLQKILKTFLQLTGEKQASRTVFCVPDNVGYYTVA